jgi:hypothetical protein
MKTYVKIEKKVLEKIEEITNTNYNAEDVYLTTENLVMIIDDLLVELGKMQDKLNDLENDLNDNYRPIPVAEQVAISDKDFI